MSITYLLGRSGPGKNNQMYEEIRNALEAGEKKLFLLVPEQSTLAAEAAAISRLQLPGLLDFQVVSFRKLSRLVSNELEGPGEKGISDAGKSMLLRKIFEEKGHLLQVFGSSYGEEGFLRAIAGFLEECKREGVLDRHFLSADASLENESTVLKKIQDIHVIYQAYQEVLDNKYLDEAGELDRLAENLDSTTLLENARIWVEGFHSFSGQEYAVLEKIMDRAKGVTISLTLDPQSEVADRDVFETPRQTFRRLQELAARKGLKENREHPDNPGERHQELAHLEREFFSFPYKIYGEKPGRVHLFAAMDPYREAAHVAGEMLRLARDSGYRWRDMAIITNSLPIYGPVLKQVFTDYGIPLFIDEKKSVMHHPLVAYLRSALRVVLRDFMYEDLFIHVKTGFTNLEQEEGELLENYALARGIKGKTWQKVIPDNPILEEARNKLVAPLLELQKATRKEARVKGISTALFSYLEATSCRETINQLMEKAMNRGEFEAVQEHAQVWNMVLEVLDQAVEILGDTPMHPEQYLRLLDAALSDYSLGFLPPSMDQVLAGSLERSKSHEMRALFLMGVNDGSLPGTFQEDGILLDREKLELQQLGFPFYSDQASLIQREQFTIYEALSKPTEYLYMTYSIADLEGKARRPSLLVDRLRRLFPLLETGGNLGDEDKNAWEKITLPVPTFLLLQQHLRRGMTYGTMGDDWWTIYQWYSANPLWQNQLQMLHAGLFYENKPGQLPGTLVRQGYQNPMQYSITRLETYANCPFKHFIAYGLKPEERKVFQLQLPDMGTLYHDSLEMFARHLEQSGEDWKTVELSRAATIMDIVLEQTGENFQHGILESSHRYQYMKEKLKRVSRRTIRVLTEQLQKGEFIPFQYELAFQDTELHREDLGKSENRIPAIVVELADGTQVRIQGRIDRMDLYQKGKESYFRVIDYKSGSKRFSLQDFHDQLQLQLVVYLWAVARGGQEVTGSPCIPAGAFYFRIDDPMVEMRENKEDQVENAISSEMGMDGFLLADKEIAEAMDQEIGQTGKSSMLPVSVNQDGQFSLSSATFSREDLEAMIHWAEKSAEKIAASILTGMIEVSPCQRGTTVSCNQCNFQAICQFDPSLPGNQYRRLRSLAKNEILEIIRKERRGTDGQMD